MKNIRTGLIVSVLAIIIAFFSLYKSYNSVSLVYVDVNKLMEGYSRTKLAKAEFEKKAAILKANVDSLQIKWETELKNYEKERQSLSDKELSLRQELLSNKQQQFSSYQEAVKGQILEEDKKITQTVINDINDYVKEYGKSHGYNIIFGANGEGSIMYASENSDLTDEILKGLNSEYDKK